MDKRLLKVLKHDYAVEMDKKRNLKAIRTLYDMNEKEEYHIDEQTWNDLDLDKVYSKLDRNYSSLGEASLYSMLRNPLNDEKKLNKRREEIEYFKENEEVRFKIMWIFFELGRDKKNSLLDMINEKLIESNKFKYYFYTITGKILPLILILTAIFVSVSAMLGLMAVTFVNIYINSKERDRIKANGLMYLRRVIKASKQIVKINDKNLDDFNIKIRENLKDLKSIDRNTIMISFINMWGGVFEFISVLFLLEETAYYKIADSIEKNKDSILSLYKTLGEMEAIISIGSYEEEKKDKITRPKFIRKTTLEIKNGIHPIIENPVANSINMSKRGIVLTGTNMSGKSTFLRMLGVNMLFAQAFNFVLAEKYEGPIFNIVTSISPNDDLSVGKSFYMAEAESILRIIRALDKDLPVFCAIDEIFRGTNPIERISASAEILTYINNKNSISIVATHDRELVDILKECYEFYYFSENVDSKNGLSFDYKLKRGVSKTRNAIKLLEYIGYPKDIINKSYRRSEKLEGFI
ncbi:MutS family DNA mismatch repair protein [Clostridium perfringens]|uniref:MutS family DNA mismatch repair protein n=1 Tax=Clostridium perfringens TaxID=1502 RepID=UPI001ABB6596|nr:MutS family DNA mismatch repair protein [Clostridium perfringens]MBO3313415.1 DNA mismatch repair protein MutS [Clostridium perfringens]